MKKLVAMFALLLAAFALVACGGGDDTTSDTTSETPTTQEESGGGEGEKEAEGGTAGAATFDVEADPSGALAYTTDQATAEAGKVTVNFTNSSPVPHDVRIEDSSGENIGGTEVLSEGNESTTVNLKPGEYTYFCSVPGHRQGGMEGTLTVK
jgi:plastocyanin